MYCIRCGTALQQGERFCAGCGNPTGSVPLMPVRSRLAGHIRLLAILWFAISAFRLIPGVVLLLMFGPDSSFLPRGIPGFINAVLLFSGYMFLGSAALGLLTAWGLYDRQPWGRMLAIVLGCLSFFDMLFGIALGIYTLWVLLPTQSEQEYRQISFEAQATS